MTKAFIHQPDFLPWIGYFIKLAKSDIFIVLDDVQFNRRGVTHGEKILAEKKEKWITVPVKKKGNYRSNINEIIIDNTYDWQKKHMNLMYYNYKKCRYFEVNFEKIKKIYERKFEKLIDFNLELLELSSKILQIPYKKKILSSELNLEEKKNEKIIKLLIKVKAKTYITGAPSLNYLDLKDFKERNIELDIVKGNELIFDNNKEKYTNKNLSIIDFIFNYVDGKKKYFKAY